MEYVANKVDGQDLMFHVQMKHKDKDLAFNVVCAADESEIEDLIQVYLDMLDNPPVVKPQVAPQFDAMALIKEQQAMIEALKARLDAAKI